MSDDLRIKVTSDITSAEKNFEKVIKSMHKLAYQNELTEKEIKDTSKAIREMSKAFKDATTVFKDSGVERFTKSSEELHHAMKKLSKDGTVTTKEFEKLKGSLKDLNSVLKGTYDPTKKLSKGLKDSGDVATEIGKGLKTTEKKVSELGSKTKKTSSEMEKFTKTMNKNSGVMRRLGVDANRTAKEFSLLSKAISSIGLGKLTAVYGLGTFFAKALQGASDIVESINLFNVAMGEFAVETGNYFNRISNSAGLDATFLLQASANYMLLAKSMGLGSENANTLAKSVTNLGIDLSSLMNIPFEQVMADLKSGLLGQTETVYKYGMDLTEAALKQEALRLGIEKSVSVMSQAEKMMLRYSVMIRTGAIANGDFAKTIETPANQLKILSQQVVQLSRTIGTVFLNALGGILPYINGFIMALRVLIETIAGLLGFETPKFENMSTGFGSAASASADLGDSIDSNTGSAKKLKKALKDLTMGFDELNIIPEQPEPTPTASGGVGGVGGIGGEIPLPDLSEYTARLDEVKMKAIDIRDSIMSWLGYTKEVDEETGKVTWKLEDGYTKIELIRDAVLGVGLAFLTWKIAAILPILGSLLGMLLNIAKWAGTVAKLLLFGNVRGAIAALLGPLASVGARLLAMAGITPTNFGIAATLVFMGARLVDLYNNNEQFRTGVERLKEIWDSVWGVLQGFGEWFMNTFISPAVEGVANLGSKFLDLLPESVAQPIRDFFTFMDELIKTIGLDFTDLITILAGIGLLFTPASPFGIALLVFELITIAIRALGSLSDEQWAKIKETVGNALSAIGEFFVNLWNDIKVILEPFWKILKDIIDILIEMAVYLGGKFVEAFKTVWKFIKEHVIEPFKENWSNVVKLFKENGDKIVESWQNLKAKLEEAWKLIKEKVFDPFVENILPKLKELFVTVMEALQKAWGNLKDAIKNAWKKWIKPTLEKFGKFVKEVWDNFIKPTLDLIIELFGDLASDIMDYLGGVIDFLIGVFTGDWDRAWLGIKNILISIWNGLVSIVETGINIMVNLINWFIRKINKVKLPDWLGGFGFNISEIEKVELPKLELAVSNIENKVGELEAEGPPNSKSVGRSTMMSGSANLIPNYSNYNRSLPQISQSQFNYRQGVYDPTTQQSQTETIINNVLTLDGEVIYKNQKKIKSQKGYDFGNPAFAR